jgi:hypothetical protein
MARSAAANRVQTFCTSSRRPETGRSLRRRGQRTAAAETGSCGSTLTAPRRHSWKRKVGPAEDPSGVRVEVMRIWPAADRLGLGDTGGRGSTRPQGESPPSSVGVGGASVPGRSSKLKGANASQATATNRPPLTSEPLRPSGRSRGQAQGPALTGCAPPPRHPTHVGVKENLTPEQVNSRMYLTC